jgi:recombinational DNA repair ATPase RecF
VKVIGITIDNVLGIEHFEFRPGAVSILAGRNGVGKTSVLEAIRSALRGGHDPSLLRRGAEKGSVLLRLEDGTQITKTIGREASPLKVSLPGAGRVS